MNILRAPQELTVTDTDSTVNITGNFVKTRIIRLDKKWEKMYINRKDNNYLK